MKRGWWLKANSKYFHPVPKPGCTKQSTDGLASVLTLDLTLMAKSKHLILGLAKEQRNIYLWNLLSAEGSQTKVKLNSVLHLAISKEAESQW